MVMPRHFRRMRRMLPPIVSYKHQVAESVSYAGLDANQQTVLYFGQPPVTPSGGNLVPAGHKVYSVDVSVNFVSGDQNTTGTYSWMLCYMRQDQQVNIIFAAVGAANWSVIGLSNARNQVIKSYMGIVGTEDAGPIRQNVHIKIPKIYQRVREGDQLILVFNADAAGTYSTGFRYKDYS